MSEVFMTASTDPDIRAIKDERDAIYNELRKMESEMQHLRSDNEALKELVIRQAMRLNGVMNYD